MPLHLLGKKSWNVYNSDNIARVRRDEEAARVAEEAAEQRMQEADDIRRTAILRGEAPPPLTDDGNTHQITGSREERDPARAQERAERKRQRNRRGEDDTARDIRLAREDAEAGLRVQKRLKPTEQPNLALQDAAGHIQLFAEPDERQRRTKAEQDAKSAKQRQTDEESMGMRFSHAAGYRAAPGGPWYVAKDRAAAASQTIHRDAFGNEDKNRQQRDEKRTIASDPMAAMRAAQSRLKQSSREKAEWEARQKAKIEQLDQDDRRHRRRRGRERSEDDELEGFSLDARKDTSAERRHRHERRDRSHDGRRSSKHDRDRSRSPDRHGNTHRRHR